MTRLSVTRLAWAALFAAACGTVSATTRNGEPTLRLPDIARPIAYQVDLVLDPRRPTFTGTVVIEVEVTQPSTVLWLNGTHIRVRHARLSMGGRTLDAVAQPAGSDFLKLRFSHALPAGTATLSIEYESDVETLGSLGVFHAKEKGEDYLFTQFESVEARRAFPCFDEPGFKTPWHLTLHVPRGDVAYSNTPVARHAVGDDGEVFEFKPTEPLPSYLIAFGVGPLERVDAGKTDMKGAPVGIVVPQGESAAAAYAAETSARILSEEERYFNIPYPYLKSDQMAIPATYGFEAMENPGLVTYAQWDLLARPENDTEERRREYFRTAAHELAHQWFGDYVTPKWWDDIWLNEAFATWMATRVVAEMQPTWGDREDAVNDKVDAQVTDVLLSARKIRQEVLTTSDIASSFDSITYAKGGAVIGMFESWMGPEVFRRGVQQYMTAHPYGSADTHDFLSALDAVSPKPVSPAFLTFTDQPGVPKVTAKLDCVADKAVVHVDQERLLPLGSKGDAKAALWQIPLCLRYPTANGTAHECQLVDRPHVDIVLSKSDSCPAWVEANDAAKGYYVVDYSPELLAKLGAATSGPALTPVERLDLVQDENMLANSGQANARELLELVERLHDDSDRHVVLAALHAVVQLHDQLIPADLEPSYQAFIQRNFSPRARALGWMPKPGESEDDRLLRPELVQSVATFGGDRVLAREGRALAEHWLNGTTTIDAALLEPVLIVGTYYGDVQFTNALIERFGRTDDVQTRQRIVSALQQVRDRAAIQTVYAAVLSGRIPFIEGSDLLFAGQGEPSTRMLSFENVRRNYERILKIRPMGGDWDLAARLPDSGATFCTPEARSELARFFSPRTPHFLGGQRALDQTLERVDLCIARRAVEAPQVAEFLRSQPSELLARPASQ